MADKVWTMIDGSRPIPTFTLTVIVKFDGKEQPFDYTPNVGDMWGHIGQTLAANIDKVSWCLREGVEYDGVLIGYGDNRG